jgi:two-component system nitrate/nitrite response regulator NarL
MKIALIDDERMFLESLQSYLVNVDYINKVDCFLSINSFLKFDTIYDLLLVDLKLEGESGFDILRKKHKSKVVFVTSYREHSKINYAYRNGAYGYVTKSTPVKEMLEAIKTAASGNIYYSPKLFRKDKIKVELKLDELTTKEYSVLKDFTFGMNLEQIAEKNHVSTSTIKVHKHNILKKFGLLHIEDVIQSLDGYFQKHKK